jgi:hypothetical protein
MEKKTKTKRLVEGLGINDVEVVTFVTDGGRKVALDSYTTWTNMLKRCYSDNTQGWKPTYRGCRVCEEWKTFSNFKKWFDENYIAGYQIDKDILFPGNRVYSPETCCFVTAETNTCIRWRKREVGDLLLGVHQPRNSKKFVATMSNKNLGTYFSEEEAHAVYCAAKREVLYIIAEKQVDKRVRAALITRADNFYPENLAKMFGE